MATAQPALAIKVNSVVSQPETCLKALGLRPTHGALHDQRVTGLSADSRSARPGFLFAALPGSLHHGAVFARQAIECGAATVLTDPEGFEIAMRDGPPADVSFIVADNPRKAFSVAAARYFGRQPEIVAAVTGTNGKTSVAHFVRQIWERLEHRAASVGTLGVHGAMSARLQHTTPDPVTLHRHLASMDDQQITHAVIEASSHGLAQHRLDGVELMAAAFTNFSRDHLDYHDDLDEYFSKKARLFSEVMPPHGAAVVNLQADRAPAIIEIARERGLELCLVGCGGEGDLSILDERFEETGQSIRYRFQGHVIGLRLGLIGGFQAENVLVAAGLAIMCGEDVERVVGALESLTTVPGRMQFAARRDNGAAVFVDYAHTPDALEAALQALRPHVRGKIAVVFGAGGDRDTGKRPLMGKAAKDHADRVIVTDDNPRHEDPAEIRSQVLQGCPDAMNVGDRAHAILEGVRMLEHGDALLVAGKGHEAEQVIGDDVHPFDDTEQASLAVAVLDGKRA